MHQVGNYPEINKEYNVLVVSKELIRIIECLTL